MVTLKSSGVVLTREQAQEFCDGWAVPRPGQMRLIKVGDSIGWLRCLYVTHVLLFQAVESAEVVGIDLGSVRSCYH